MVGIAIIVMDLSLPGAAAEGVLGTAPEATLLHEASLK
jgi:hypothetical protein